MMRMIDCMVSYFGLDEDERPAYRRYSVYHVRAGPGPTADSGVAFITALAASHQADRCMLCETIHIAETGGAAAAMAVAIRHLDSYHGHERLRKVQSDIRGLGGEETAVDVSSFETPSLNSGFKAKKPE